MRFSFTEEQLEFRDAVRALLDKECPASTVRAAWSNATGRTDDAWTQLVEMGVIGLTGAESVGGFGGDELDLVLVLEEAGRAALPEPIVEHTAVALPLLDNERAGAAARGEWTLSTGHRFVPYADSVDALVLEHEGALYLVDRTDTSLTARESVDGSRRLFEVDWSPSAGTRVGGADQLVLAFDRGALGTAAQLLGLADHMLETTVEYARQREQFGAPIGSFQAVKHHLADVALELEFARPLVYRAAYSVARCERERSAHVSMAKARASESALLAARVALQVHGAIGYTTEYDLHLWMKRAWALAAAWGDAPWHRRRVGRAILGPEGPEPAEEQ